MESRMSCDAPCAVTLSNPGYVGPVQLAFADTDGIDDGWIRLLPVAS